MFKWIVKSEIKAQNAIFLGDADGEKGRPFKARFLQAGLVKYDFGVCLLQKETIDKFVNTFIDNPVIINHIDDIESDDVCGTIEKVWFSPEDGWFWCSGVITDKKAVKLISEGYNVSCQYRITDYSENTENKLHNGNPYDKEILDGVFEHLAIVENPRYEGAFIAVNAYLACNKIFKEQDHPRDDEGKFSDGGNTDSQNFNDAIDKIKSGEYPRSKQVTVSDKPSDVWLKAGLQNKKIVMPAAVFHKATAEKHNVDEETIRKFPELMQDPPFIFKSSTEQGSFVGVLDAVEKDGDTEKPLIVAVKPVNDRVEVNIITSTYGKDKDFVRRETEKGNLLYKRKKTASNSIVASLATETLKPSANIITGVNDNFNPKVNKYNKVFEWIRNSKGETMDKETKGVFEQLLSALKARNEADAEDEKKEKEKEDAANKAKNEEVDKRDIIRQIMAIAGKHEDNEDVRTIAKLAEKLAYDKSEAGTADNGKAKNEDDEEEPKKKEAENEDDEKKCDKDEAKNKAKNEEEKKLYEELKKKVDEEAKNKVAKNALDEAVNKIYSAVVPSPEDTYISSKKGLELGTKIYG
nr:MAG TPA: hypothetical protein [Caudoviricetes sp.]